MTPRPLLLLPVLAAFVACGPPLKLADPNKKAAEPTAEAESTEDEAPAGEEKKPAKKKKKVEKKADKGPFHWKDYPGPKLTTAITTKMVWAVVPVGLQGDFSTAKLALLEYVKAEGDEHLVKIFGDDTIYVPQAMVQPAIPAKGVTKGAALMVNVAASSGFGRVTDLTKGEGGAPDKVKIKYEWAGQVSDAELGADETVLLEDKVAFGHPVSYPVGAEREVGVVVLTDKDTTWVLDGPGKVLKAATKDVKPMEVKMPLKKG